MSFDLGGALNLRLRATGKRRCTVKASIALAPTRTQCMSWVVGFFLYMVLACIDPEGCVYQWTARHKR